MNKFPKELLLDCASMIRANCESIGSCNDCPFLKADEIDIIGRPIRPYCILNHYPFGWQLEDLDVH